MLNKIDKAVFIGWLPERERCTLKVYDSFNVYSGGCGNFTVIVIEFNGKMYTGVSKRNPCDLPSESGYHIAAVRAWRDYVGKDPGYSRHRPISKKAAKQASTYDRVVKVLDGLGIEVV